MHEWLEALQKSAKTTAPGAAAEELRRSETEFGIPLPGELGDLYAALNGGTFEGGVVLFPLTAEGELPSVQQKTRKMLVGLPVAGVWRFGVKGAHRHLFAARKSAMLEQGDGGGPLPEWVQALGDDDWLYGTWDEEQKDMRLYRALSQMLPVLVPPVEHEDFGDRTFARAIAAVEGALTELTSGSEEEASDEEAADEEEGAQEEAAEEDEAAEAVQDLQYEYEEGQAPEAGEASKSPGLQQPAVMAAERRVKSIKRKPARKEVVKSEAPAKQGGEGLEKPAVIAAERRVKNLAAPAAPEAEGEEAPRKKAAARTAARKSTEQAPAASKAPARKAAPAKRTAKKVAAKKAPAQKSPAKKAPAKKAPAKKAPAKKAPAKKAAVKKALAKKAPAKKAPVQKSPAKKGAVMKGAAKKAPAKKAAAKKAPAKKAGRRG
jgi:hypothetical protein